MGLAVVGVYSYYIARQSLLHRTFNQLTSVREEKGKQVENFFNDRIREAEYASVVLSSNGLCHANNILENINIQNSQGKSEQLKLLLNFLWKAGCYNSIGFGFTGGQFVSIRLKSNGLHDDVYTSTLEATNLLAVYQEVIKTKNVLVKDFSIRSLLGENSAFVAAPIQIENSITGVVFLEITEKSMNDMMSEGHSESGLGQTGEVYLVGSDYLMRSSSRFFENSVLSVECKTSAIDQALSGLEGTSKIFDYRNVKVLSSFRPIDIPQLKWVIAAEMDWSEALRDVNRFKNHILIIGLAVFLLLTFGVFMFSWKVTEPLIKLKEAALRIGDGKFDVLLPIEQRDEIGLLTQVFNKMTLRLKQTTRRLQEREQRLLHFYRATVDGIMLHSTGKPVMVNRALVALSGFTEEELLKISPEVLFKGDDHLLHFADPCEVFSFETELITKQGKQIPVEVQQKRMKFHEQEVDAIVIRDISKRKEVENELMKERLQRFRSVFDGQEQERQRLSRELHDGLGQTLVGIKLRLESIPLEKLGEERKTIEIIKNMFNQTIEETRRISNNLMPAALTQFSLAVVLRNLCTEFESNSGITVSLVVGVLPESLNQMIKTYAYRIAQEALTNIVKHSNASRAVISVFSDIFKLYLHIEDNGIGFETSKVNDRGNGLYNMKERTSLLNGKFLITSSKGQGTKIQVEFPLDNLRKQRENGKN